MGLPTMIRKKVSFVWEERELRFLACPSWSVASKSISGTLAVSQTLIWGPACSDWPSGCKPPRPNLTGSLKSCLYDTGASRVVLSTSASKALYFDQNLATGLIKVHW